MRKSMSNSMSHLSLGHPDAGVAITVVKDAVLDLEMGNNREQLREI